MTKIYFRTQGCSTNKSESEVMAGLLAKAGFPIVNNIYDADIILLNVCTVKGNKTAFNAIKELTQYIQDCLEQGEGDKKLIIAGCIPKASYDEFRELAPDASFINTDNILQVVEVVEETRHDNPVTIMTKEKKIKIGLPRIRGNKVVAIIPICSGCADSCAYCGVKSIKGKLFSYPEETILDEARKAIIQDCKEIWITAQDTGAYGLDHKSRTDSSTKNKSQLPELLLKLCELEGDFKIRVGMFNPTNVLPVLDELITVYKSAKIFKFIHVPLQSGSDKILEGMNRKYSVEEFKSVVYRFRKEFPDVSFATDVIVGFLGETDEQFEQTLEVIKELKPDVLNRSRFQEIKGTRAAHMEGKVHGNVIKERSQLLSSIFMNIGRMNNERWFDKELECIIDDKKEDFIARDDNYRLIVVKQNKPKNVKNIKKKFVDGMVVEVDTRDEQGKGEEAGQQMQNLLGQRIKVKIKAIRPNYLVGERIE